MTVVAPRRGFTSERRLRLILLLLMAWEVLGLAAQVSFGGPLAHIADGRLGGPLAARVSFSGASLVPLVLYGYAFFHGPLRLRGVLWLAALEQLAGALFAVYHVTSDIEVEGMVLSVVVSVALLVLLLTSMPREQTTS